MTNVLETTNLKESTEPPHLISANAPARDGQRNSIQYTAHSAAAAQGGPRVVQTNAPVVTAQHPMRTTIGLSFWESRTAFSLASKEKAVLARRRRPPCCGKNNFPRWEAAVPPAGGERNIEMQSRVCCPPNWLHLSGPARCPAPTGACGALPSASFREPVAAFLDG